MRGTIRSELWAIARDCKTFFEFTEAVEAWAVKRWGERDYYRFNETQWATTSPLLELFGKAKECAA